MSNDIRTPFEPEAAADAALDPALDPTLDPALDPAVGTAQDRADAQGRGSTRAGFAVLWVAIKREPWIFAVSTLGSVLFGALTVADAWVLGWSTDHVVLPAFRDGEIGSGLLWTILALFLGVALLRAVGIVARRLGAGIMQYRMQAGTRRAVTRRYLALPMEWHQRHPTGELLSNANSDVEAAWVPIAPLPMAVGTIAMMVIAVAQMFVADVVLALVGLLIFPAVIATNIVYQGLAQGWATRAQQLRAEVSEIAHESFDGAMVVKTLGREPEETERFAAKARELRDVNIRVGRIRAAFDPTLAALPNVGVLVVLAVGVSRVMNGHTAPGDVVTIAYLLTIVSFPIRSIGWLLGEFPRSVVGYRRVDAVLRTTGEMTYGDHRTAPAAGGARLEVSGLDHGYTADQRLLDDLSFVVEPGRTVALVGATASGKSTLTTLLTRLVDPRGGTISVDGTDVRDFARGELAAVASIVPQTAFLFDDTVRGNVTLGADVSEEEVWDALRTAQADGFVAALPDGLSTRLGERGTSLSGGQRQRISLARALVRRPRLLILDDATSAVDPEVEARILAGLRSGGTDTTLVVVAYRKATIGLADEVLHLEAGRIADRGTHTELLRRSPAYARLVNAYEQPEHPEHPENADLDDRTSGGATS
ncbi:ABC transporter ATP-binding protein [soil metagenome]